jgi:hypothetical protein
MRDIVIDAGAKRKRVFEQVGHCPPAASYDWCHRQFRSPAIVIVLSALMPFMLVIVPMVIRIVVALARRDDAR